MCMYCLDEGSFTHLAAIKSLELIGERKLLPLCSPKEIALAVKENIDSYGTLAYENSIAGKIEENIELINKHRLKVAHKIIIPIIPCLGVYPGRERNIIYSHPKALEQCSDFLSKNYPYAKRIEVSSTVKGMMLVKERKSGMAIGRKDYLIKQGLEVIAENIANRESFTEFFIIKS